MVTFREVERILEWSKSRGARIIIDFKGYPYSIVIDRFIRAAERGGGFVEWHRAFGPRPPHLVLSSMRIERVIVEEGDHQETLKSLEELLRRVS